MVSPMLKVCLSLYTLLRSHLRSHLFVNCCIRRYSIYTSSKVKNGRTGTTTCDPIVSMRKNRSQNECFSTNKNIARIGPLTRKGLIWRGFCPLTVAKVQKGGFHGCQRLSKSRLRAMTAIRGKFLKKEGISCRWRSLQSFSHQKTFETGSKLPHLTGGLFFIGEKGPRSHPH